MITGFNTDVEHEGVVYHVQTEDKGVETPLILSLVYNRGTILASKRVPYADLLTGSFDEKLLADRLQKQHKTICAAVRAGRIEELKQMTAKDSAKQKSQKAEPKTQTNGLAKEIRIENEVSAPKNIAANVLKEDEKIPAKPTALQPAFPAADSRTIAERIDQAKAKTDARIVSDVPKTSEKTGETFIPKPSQELVAPISANIYEGELITGNFEIIEEEPIIEAVQILTDFAKPEFPKGDKLQIEFMSETVFKGGDRKTVSIFVHRGNREKGIGEAQVMVKILGSSFRPLIFHAKTDSNGVATVHLQLPHFRSGRAAILVRAISSSEEAELRRVVAHG